jgi:phage shock protein A
VSLSSSYGEYGNTYVGNTVLFYFVLNVFGLPTTLNTLYSFQLTTPWANYTDPTVAVQFCSGCVYTFLANVTIPATLQPGPVNVTVSFTGRYANSDPFCASTGDVCSSWITIVVTPDPFALQNQVEALQTSVASLGSQVANLTTQLATATSNVSALNSKIATYQAEAVQYQNQISSLTSQLTTANQTISTLKDRANTGDTQISSLKSELTAAQNNATSMQASLTASNNDLQTAKANLASVQGQLTAAQTKLSSVQSSLNDYSEFYLPLGVVLTAFVAAFLLLIYIRRHPRIIMTSGL